MSKQTVTCDSFTCVLGINEGYFHYNEVPTNIKIGTDIQRIADDIYAETGRYIGAVVVPAKVVYREEWGCPKGGEDVYVLSGNSFFIEAVTEKDKQEWKDLVELFILRLKEHFKQSTVQVEWSVKTIVRYV